MQSLVSIRRVKVGDRIEISKKTLVVANVKHIETRNIYSLRAKDIESGKFNLYTYPATKKIKYA